MTYAYMIGGMLVGLILHRTVGMGCENAVHALMGMYATVLVIALMERNGPWALYYASAISISVAVLWMNSRNG